MSYLEKMSIQGIRSFGPDEEDMQIINFFTPLTLILGPNGTGKTTIIECLRYITTGDTPPNTKQGSFFHDPTLSGNTEVKGQVKLKFVDVENKKASTTRSVIATQKRSKLEVKTVDNTIERTMPNGEKNSITQKCAQIDKEMINCLGVSKAVLVHVIFCHQEESSWPLAEGKSVKEKFDAIFAATRYIKALDEIRKIRTTLTNEVKEHTTDIKHLRNNKDKAIELTNDLKEAENLFIFSKNKVDEIDKEIKPIHDKLCVISSKEGEISKLKNEVGNFETSLVLLGKNRNEYLKNIQDVFVGTDAELKTEIKSFATKLNQKKNELEEEKRKNKSTEKECNLIREKKSKAMMELGKLKTVEQQQKERLATRSTRVIAVAKETSIPGFDDKKEELLETEIEDCMKQLQQKMDHVMKEHNDVKTKFETEENGLQEKIQSFHDQRLRLEQTVKLNENRKKDNEKEVENITRELKRVDSSAKRQKELETSLTKLEEQKKTEENSVDDKALKEELAGNRKEKSGLDAKLNSVNQEINKLHSEGQKRTELDLFLKDKTSKEASIHNMSKRHEDTLLHLLGKMPERNVLESLEAFNKKLQQELRTTTKDLNDMKSKMSSLETTRTYQMKDVKSKENNLQVHQEKIFLVGGSSNFEETLTSLQKSLQELQDDKGALIGSKVTYNKYIEKLRNQKPCCPLCQRGFQEEQDAQELAEHLKRKILLIPEQVEAKEVLIDEQQKKLNSMLELRPLQEEIKKLKEVEIPEAKTKLAKVNSDIEALRTKISDTQEDVDSKQSDSKMYDSIHPDMVVVNQHEKELVKIEKQLDITKQKLGVTSGTSRSVEEATDEREEIQLKMQSLTRAIDGVQQRLNNHMESLNNLSKQINGQKSELLQITGDQQKRQSLEENKTKLVTEIAEMTTSIQESKIKIDTLKSQWHKMKVEKESVVETKQSQLNVLKNKHDKMDGLKKDITTITKEIKKYLDEGYSNKIVQCNARMEQLATQLQEKETSLKTVNQNIEQLQHDLANQEKKERELTDNLNLKICEKSISDKQKECDKIKLELGSVDATNLFKEKETLTKQYTQLKAESQKQKDRYSEQGGKVSLLKKELNTEQYKNADKEYKEKFIMLRTKELAASDLGKYYVALDRAIMKFHKIKMDEINKIIRELWSRTYRGNDIDFIEIQSDSATAETGMEKKRTYNYRVVMNCNGTEMDMRGRCSAGQKVLASLIIRLALAETFCLNCGVFALDEPTTNLDRENIESLAHALVEIVKSRSKQRNFQLIVITHDEDFIDLLGRTSTVDYFWKVSKNHKCFSQLTKCTTTGEISSR